MCWWLVSGDGHCQKFSRFSIPFSMYSRFKPFCENSIWNVNAELQLKPPGTCLLLLVLLCSLDWSKPQSRRPASFFFFFFFFGQDAVATSWHWPKPATKALWPPSAADRCHEWDECGMDRESGWVSSEASPLYNAQKFCYVGFLIKVLHPFAPAVAELVVGFILFLAPFVFWSGREY